MTLTTIHGGVMDVNAEKKILECILDYFFVSDSLKENINGVRSDILGFRSLPNRAEYFDIDLVLKYFFLWFI